jgi:hypothetical protein
MFPQHDQLAFAVAVRQLLWHSHCELLLLEAGSWGWGQFRNPEEVGCWKLLPSNDSEDVNVDTSVILCACVSWVVKSATNLTTIYTLSCGNICNKIRASGTSSRCSIHISNTWLCPYAHYLISTHRKYAALMDICIREYMLSLSYDMK